MKTCITCGEDKELSEYYRRGDGYRGECKACRSIADVIRYAKYPQERVARHVISNAIRDGKLIKQPCQVCGALKVEAHHTDYSQPLNVRWLCRKHHIEAHNHA